MTAMNRAAGCLKRALVLTALSTLLAAPKMALAADPNEPVFTPIQHATFAIQAGEVTIFVDPVGKAESFTALGSPDIILITDIHGDHLAPDVVQTLTKEKTTVIGPESVVEALKNGKVLKNGETTRVGTVEIEAIPMYNLSEDRQKFHEKGRGNGYLVTLAGKRIYISGDTEDIPEMRALENVDYAFVCMNLPYTMTVAQAADAVLEFKPKVVLPYHYRGQGGFSDVEEFEKLVGQDPSIEVRLLKWYE